MIFRPPSRFINRSLTTGLLFALAAAAPISASAQQRVGSTTSPNVVVDYSVLDQLGRTPNVADVLGGGRLAAPAARSPYATRELQFPIVSDRSQNALPGQIKLRPPSASRTGTAARRSPKRLAMPTSPKPPATVTARRTAPTTTRTTTRTTPPTPLRPPPPPRIAEPPAGEPMAAPTPPSPPTAPTAPSIASAAPPAPPPVPSLPAAAAPQQSTSESARESITPPPVPALPSNAASSTGTTVAALPPPAPLQSQARLGVGSSLRVGFSSGSAKLDPPAETELKRVADALKGDDALRIQLLAYAGSSGNSASQARRLSLSRALAARSSLINQGIKSARIDVRALGDKAAGGPPDRIDIIVTKR